ncbi:hypothetical protein [Helicobacter pylori]|uniref:hypothetical protein n=1 Tax=Helicobacter pylori TaxID=210 RepID=UPI001FD236F5|nr:hypothetical protein [Helicobacter pylori]UOR68634.1 hypothetical protein MPF90_04115 [Helicobacter pylori]
MWGRKIIRVMPAILFLFCLLEVFELVLTINGMNKAEKLEVGLMRNLESLGKSANLLSERLNGMGSEYCKNKR